MKSITILFFTILLCFQMNAQTASSWRFDLQGYNVVFPGLQVAKEFPILTINTHEAQNKSNFLQLRVAPTAEIYFYRGNHTGISLNGELNVRYHFDNNFEMSLYGSFGALEAILVGKVFMQNPDGTFTSSSAKGNLYSQWNTGFVVGKSFQTSNDRKYTVSARAGVRQATFPAAAITPNIGLSLNWYTNN